MTPWWSFAWECARWEVARLRRCWRPEAAQDREPEFTPEPEPLPVRQPLPAADATEAAPAYTIPEECRLHVLAERLRLGVDSDGFRRLGTGLADELRETLPGVPDSHIARVLLALEPVLERLAAEQDELEVVMTVFRDSLLGAPPVLAELDLALAERGPR